MTNTTTWAERARWGRIADAHGFDWRPAGDGIEVAIPWTRHVRHDVVPGCCRSHWPNAVSCRDDEPECGTDWERASTLSELRGVLGY